MVDRSAPGRPPLLVAILGPTATGKSALGIALAHRFDGEVVGCDSTAVYRGFDIGTDKMPAAQQGGIPHHMIDVAEPTEAYSAARYAREAAAVIRDITRRGKLPILVGGTGLYYRALTRGFFPGPSRDPALRARLERIAGRRGTERLHRLLGRVDAESAARIQPRDRKRLIRALEVYLLTGRPLTSHFADTEPPLPEYRVAAFALRIPPEVTAERVARRVEAQFDQGILGEIRALLNAGVPETAHPFSGLVYRQALEHLRGVRDEAATRELIVRENRKYSRRQLLWFRKEPNLQWIHAAGERAETLEEVARALTALEIRPDAPDS
ncbi:MAG TPA: tRNA (adenosine(37)-N6)-dimethylallyltransferase MiaA [Vicinamibacterales bacterium]|nr:tRNA (adenosine(37)-N6)-dimethylallyltransferase MiaA [Vicinamibacterales bacterium]